MSLNKYPPIIMEPISLKLPPFLSNSLVGLDVSPNGAALVHLQKAARAPLPSELFKEQIIVRFDLLLPIITDLVKELGLYGKPAGICLPSAAVRMERVQLSRGLSDEEMMADIQIALQQAIPSFNEPFSFDFAPLPAMGARVDKMEVLVAATPTHYLSTCIDCIREAGLVVKIVDVDTFALRRQFYSEIFLPGAPQAAAALLLLQKSRSLLMVFNETNVFFYQILPIPNSAEWTVLHDALRLVIATLPALQLRSLVLVADDVSEIAVPENSRLLFAEGVSVKSTKLSDCWGARGVALWKVPAW
jgi:hypothetical protein